MLSPTKRAHVFYFNHAGPPTVEVWESALAAAKTNKVPEFAAVNMSAASSAPNTVMFTFTWDLVK